MQCSVLSKRTVCYQEHFHPSCNRVSFDFRGGGLDFGGRGPKIPWRFAIGTKRLSRGWRLVASDPSDDWHSHLVAGVQNGSDSGWCPVPSGYRPVVSG
eukprot:1510297-Rhodomonas_salina.1